MKVLKYIFWDSSMLPALLSLLCSFYFIWLITHPAAPEKDWLLLITSIVWLIYGQLIRAERR